MRTNCILLVVVLLVVAPAATIGTAGAAPTGAPDQPNAVADQHLDCTFPIEVEDGTGETVTIDEEPDEVVVLAPNVAQHLWEIGAQETVIGMPVNQYTSYLNGSEQRTHILTEGENGFDVPNNELIVDLEADLVLVPNAVPTDAAEQLRASGETVYYYDRATSLETMLQQVERTGQLVGECEAATEETDELEERIDAVENAVADEEHPKIFYDFSPGSLYTANSNTLEHDVFTSAGAENIAADIDADAGNGYPIVSSEVVLAEDPEWVINQSFGLSEFPGYEDTTALSNGQIITVEDNFINQHGPRNVDVLEHVASELHPEAMEEARQAGENDTDESIDDETESGADDGSTDDSEGSDTDDSGAGLTVGAAVAAVIALALIAGRRD